MAVQAEEREEVEEEEGGKETDRDVQYNEQNLTQGVRKKSPSLSKLIHLKEFPLGLPYRCPL